MSAEPRKPRKAAPDTSVDHFRKLLHENKMRVTDERVTLYSILAEKPGTFLTVNELTERLRQRGTELKSATVYNTLSLFCRLGLLSRRKHSTGDKGYISSAFSLIQPAHSGGTKLNVVLTVECSVCGKGRVLRDSQLINYLRRHHFAGFDTSHGVADVHISALCKRCAKLAATGDHSV